MIASTFCQLAKPQSSAKVLNSVRNSLIGSLILLVKRGASLDHVDSIGAVTQVVTGILVDISCAGAE
jgi:hypothetical protein